MLIDDFARQVARETLFRLSPPSWSARVLGLQLDPWQVKQVSASPGSRVICLVHRQAGKTTGGSVAVGHTMIYRAPGSTSLVLAPTQKQSRSSSDGCASICSRPGRSSPSITPSALRSKTGHAVLPCRGRMMPAFVG